MKYPIHLLLVFSLVSCDQAKELVQQATQVITQELQEQVEGMSKGSKIDDRLKGLIDQTEEGVIFRKDLPFPTSISLTTKIQKEISGRFFHASELGKKLENVNGTEVVITTLERSGPTVKFTLQESSFTIPPTGDAKGEEAQPKKVKNPLRQMEPSLESITFQKKGPTWKSGDTEGFRAMALSKQLAPVFEELLIDNALAPRPLWFSKKRINVGDEFDVAGDAISMLVAGNAKGGLHLKFVSIEPVHGHPCGVFEVTGDYSRREFADFEGRLTDEEVTIENGKLWLSLLHPVVLKKELDTIQTFKPGGNGGLVGRGQGVIKVSVDHEWKIADTSSAEAD